MASDDPRNGALGGPPDECADLRAEERAEERA
jgi:hypothetical protein